MASCNHIAEVFLDLKAIEINHAFDYIIPDELTDIIEIGSMVAVPLGNRFEIGYVSKLKNKSGIPDKNLKCIDRIIGNISLFDIKRLSLIYWMSLYYITAIGKIIELFLPPVKKSKIEKSYARISANAAKKSSDGGLAIDLNKASFALFEKTFFPGNFDYKEINDYISSKLYKAFLFEGFINFKNKSFLYSNLCLEALKNKRKTLILMPEIISVKKLYEYLRVGFGNRICAYHSGMTEKKRLESWYGIRADDFDVIIGTRSALFTPIKDLGLIIIDDEHDPSYKDSTIVRYNTQDVALKLGEILKIPVVFASSTPSINLKYAAENDKDFKIIEIPGESRDKNILEKIVVDLKTVDRYRDDKLITNTLHKAISEEIRSGNKVIVFINKLGFSNFLVCLKCGNVPKCPECSLSYRYHKIDKKLVCHNCGKYVRYEGTCDICGGNEMSFPGYGIEKVESSLNLRFKDIPIYRIDSESIEKKDFEENIIDKINCPGPAIIIGTQMIAKDYGIKNITLAAVISCDNMLELPDYHMYERVFQLISQIAQKIDSSNSSGGSIKGKIIIQTFNPDNHVIKNFISGNYSNFYLEELSNRRELGYPPYSNLINIIDSGGSEKEVKSEIIRLSEMIYGKITDVDFSVLGPAPSPFLKINKNYRWHMVIKTKEYLKFAAQFEEIMRNFKRMEDNKIIIDVDPVWIL